MSESSDQSYYEIALTNRQVMSIFVVLLVCVLLSFLGGVWLAKDAEPTVEIAATQSILAAESKDEPLEALDFFNRPREPLEAPASGGESAAEPAPAASAADNLASEVQANVAPEPFRAPKKAAAASAAADVAPERTPLEPERRSERQPASPPTRSGAEPSKMPATAAGGAPPVPESVVIQVFSSNEQAQALRVADQLRKRGYPAILSPVEVAGRTLHRVRIGPYSDSDEAKVVAESVRRAFNFDTWITH